MKNKTQRTISRREFAQRAAVLSAAVPFVPAALSSAPQTVQTVPKLSDAAQAEADSRYQQVLTLYSERLDDAQKANIKRMCAELQPSLDRIRSFKLHNGDAPALYLKPLVERPKKPQATPTASKPAASATKP